MTSNPMIEEDLKDERARMFSACALRGMVPIEGVRIDPEQGGGIGQFLINPSLDMLKGMTLDPLPFLGGATKAQKARWDEEEKEYAHLYSLIQREFSAKKRKNVDSIVQYLKDSIDKKNIGFMPPPILWYQDGDIEVSAHFLAARRDAYPHAIDGSTRIAAIHRLAKEPAYREKMQRYHVPVIVIYGPEVDEDMAAQIFGDVNFKAIPVDPSLAKSMDQRDPHVQLAKQIEKTIPSLIGRVSSRRQLTATDTALFTKYALYQSLRCFTDGVEALDKMHVSSVLTEATTNDVLNRALDFWRELDSLFGGEWNEQEGREKFLHMQAPVLKAISAVARDAYFPNIDQSKKAGLFAYLSSIDWSRNNKQWIGLATRDGKDKPLIVNNDAAVRDLARAFATHEARVPRRAAAA